MKHWIAVLGLAAGASASQAGVVLHNLMQGKHGEASNGAGVVYAQDGKLRSEALDPKGNVTQFSLFRDGGILMFNVRDHSYIRMDHETMEKILARMPQLRATLASQRAPTWHDTGRNDKVGQFECRVWDGALAS